MVVRVFHPLFDFVTTVEQSGSMTGVRQKFVARFLSWRQHPSWAQKSNCMTLIVGGNG